MKTESLRKVLRGKVIILCHHNADPDAVCSAQAIKELINRLNTGSETSILLPGGATSTSRRVMEVLAIEASKVIELEGADTLVIVDTSSLAQLGTASLTVASSTAFKIFIDHHAPSREVEEMADFYFVDDKASSTCELVYKLYEALGVEPSQRAARAMIIGILYDSKHLSIAGSETFRVVFRLLELGARMDEASRLLTVEMDRPERIARLKAGQRMILHEIHGWLIVTSHVSSYQASAARGLIDLGADVAMVAGGVWKDMRVSLRSTDHFYRETSIHLGKDIAQRLAGEFEGSGGGHPTSAGLNLKGEYEETLRRCVELISERINETVRTPING